MLNSAIDIIQPPPASASASAVSAGLRLSEATVVPMPIASSAALTAASLPSFLRMSVTKNAPTIAPMPNAPSITP